MKTGYKIESRLEHGVRFAVLVFSMKEQRLLWTHTLHPKSGPTKELKTTVTAEYAKGVLTKVETCFFMRHHDGTQIIPVNIMLTHKVDGAFLVLTDTDLGRFGRVTGGALQRHNPLVAEMVQNLQKIALNLGHFDLPILDNGKVEFIQVRPSIAN